MSRTPPKSPRGVARSGEPRPTGSTPTSFGSCWRKARFPSRGSRRTWCSRSASGCGCYLDLLEDKAAWQHRIHATLFQHGVPKVEGTLLTGGRAEHGRDDPDLSDAGRDAVDTALRVIAALDADLT